MNHFVRRLLLFVLLTTISYLGVLFLIANATIEIQDFVGRRTNLYPLTYVRWWAYPGGDAFLRFREIQHRKNVDVLFMGSSHCFRSFDPRVFLRHNLTSFNMGSRAQTPLNSYYLLRKHIGRLRPRLVIVETYYEMFGLDGTESLCEMAENIPLESNIWQTAVSIRKIGAVNVLLTRVMDLDHESLASVSAALPDHDSYVGSGYVETRADYKGNWNMNSHRIAINSRQFEYLKRILRLASDHGSCVVLVTQPLPGITRDAILNRAEVSQRISDVARDVDVEFLDFNDETFLDEEEYYFDYHHLNQRGVEIFNERLLQELRARHLLPETGLKISASLTDADLIR